MNARNDRANLFYSIAVLRTSFLVFLKIIRQLYLRIISFEKIIPILNFRKIAMQQYVSF